MMFIDTWLVFEGCALPTAETQSEFYTNLSEELVNNTYDHVGAIVQCHMGVLVDQVQNW